MRIGLRTDPSPRTRAHANTAALMHVRGEQAEARRSNAPLVRDRAEQPTAPCGPGAWPSRPALSTGPPPIVDSIARPPVRKSLAVLHVTGVYVVGLAGDRIRELTRFDTAVAPYFGLPRTLD